MTSKTTFRQIFSKDWKLALAERRKLLTYIATGLGLVVDADVAHGTALHWVGLAILVLGGFGIHRVPNADQKD